MIIMVEKHYCRSSSSKRWLPTNNNIVKSANLITKMELQRGRRVKVPGGMELRITSSSSSSSSSSSTCYSGAQRSTFLVWRSLCSFPLMSSPANLPFKCAREGLLHCEQLMNASSPSSTHTMTADLSANSRITRSLARGVQDLRETVVVVVVVVVGRVSG
jgi:hypothetical protein